MNDSASDKNKRFLDKSCNAVFKKRVSLSQEEIEALKVRALLTEEALTETHRMDAAIRMEKARVAAKAKAEKERVASIENEAKAEKDRLEAKAREKQEKLARLNKEVKSLGLYIAQLQEEDTYTIWDCASYATLNRIADDQITSLKSKRQALILELANESKLLA